MSRKYIFIGDHLHAMEEALCAKMAINLYFIFDFTYNICLRQKAFEELGNCQKKNLSLFSIYYSLWHLIKIRREASHWTSLIGPPCQNWSGILDWNSIWSGMVVQNDSKKVLWFWNVNLYFISWPIVKVINTISQEDIA